MNFEEIFLSKVSISSTKKIREYIDFCKEKDIGAKIKFKTNHHHILPKAIFNEYSNLTTFPENGVHLLHKDHLMAHYILGYECLSDYGQIIAVRAMFNQQIENGDITKDGIMAYMSKHQEVCEKASILQSESHKNGSRVLVYDKISKAKKEYYKNLSEEEMSIRKKQISLGLQKYMKENPEQDKARRAAIGKKCKETWSKKSDKDLETIKNKKSQTWKTRSKEAKEITSKKARMNNTGSKCHTAIKVHIYNAKDELMYETHGNFRTVCSDNNLPTKALFKSYNSGGKQIYMSNNAKAQANKHNNLIFVGWYAIKL